ncbi:MAG: DUF2029 domain-containing protein [Methylacidiphilales bacterium]|nr:DUF2029 domain-containing protein [Candidatus Methylacidiphilales bacterium]NJR17744.1 DUF2029 domain-containing protein [Calothrix sp. CSU_2_0]
MYKYNQKVFNKILNIILIFAIIISTLGFFRDLSNTVKYGGVDLRNRVVGTRLLNKGFDPYFYKWTPGEDEKFLDPSDDYKLPFTKLTVPPSILILHKPFINLPYFTQRIIWFCLQWGAFLGSCLLLIKNSDRNENSGLNIKAFWIIALTFLSAHSFWKLHVYVGQMYVYYVFLISLAYFILKGKIKFKEFIAGALIGLTINLRPPIIVLILPMIIFKKFKLMGATLFGFCLSSLAFFVLAGQKAWVSYFSAMSAIAKIKADVGASISYTNKLQNFVIPKVVEGMDFEYQGLVPSENTSMQQVLKSILGFMVSGNILIFICGVILLIYSIAAFSKYHSKIYRNNWDVLFLVGTLMILIGDFWIPAPRYPYNDIQFLIPLFLVIKNINLYSYKTLVYIIIIILGLSISASMFVWLPKEIALGQFILLGTLILMSLTNNLLFTKNLDSDDKNQLQDLNNNIT